MAESQADDFFVAYAKQFSRDFSRQLRDVSVDGDIARLIDPQAIYRLLFLSGKARPREERVRASFRELVGKTVHAETVLKRAWMIMATNYVDHKLRASQGCGQDAVTKLIAEYSSLLDEVYFEASRETRIELPEVDRRSDEHLRIVRSFAAYTEQPKTLPAPRVFCCYQGVPVECSAQVLDVDEMSVSLHINRCQAAMLTHVPIALIDTPRLEHAVRAYAISVDLQARSARFSHFAPHHDRIERRAHVRVEPEQAIEARLRYGKREVTGRLLDLSAVAVALYFRGVPLYGLVDGTKVMLEVLMPKLHGSGSVAVKLPGKVIKMVQGMVGDPAAARVVVKMDANKALLCIACDYVAKRQREILSALSGSSQT